MPEKCQFCSNLNDRGGFKVGDTVSLKSGGPPMTVIGVRTGYCPTAGCWKRLGYTYECRWFHGAYNSSISIDGLSQSGPKTGVLDSNTFEDRTIEEWT